MISVRINGVEIKNPMVRLVISIGALFVVLFILALLFLIILPVIWFSVLMVLTAVILLAFIGPRIVTNYRAVLIKKKKGVN